MKKQTKCVDDITFELKSDFDFSWLSKYGRVFCVFDQQDSGNICFGVEQNGQKLFIKYAGAPTINYQGENEAAISRMKEAMLIYKALSHPNLIKLVKHGEEGMGYASIYEWVEGECLHAHWNFEQMPKYTHPKSPNVRFGKLELDKKLNCLDAIYKLHLLVAEKGFIAVDFYDGSIIYDFDKDKTTICDIDFYVKGAFVNTMGEDLWGSTRLKSPEEFEKGAIIDEVTNVYTMGAIAFELLGNKRNREASQWSASNKLYFVAEKATSADRNNRYQSIKEFYNAWEIARKETHD